MLCETERTEESDKFALLKVRRREPDIILDAAPGQKPRLLKYHGQRTRRPIDRALEILVQPGDDPEQSSIFRNRTDQ